MVSSLSLGWERWRDHPSLRKQIFTHADHIAILWCYSEETGEVGLGFQNGTCSKLSPLKGVGGTLPDPPQLSAGGLSRRRKRRLKLDGLAVIDESFHLIMWRPQQKRGRRREGEEDDEEEWN